MNATKLRLKVCKNCMPGKGNAMNVKYVTAIVSPGSVSRAKAFKSLKEAEWYAEKLKKDPLSIRIHIRQISTCENEIGREYIWDSRLLFVWQRTEGGWYGEYL